MAITYYLNDTNNDQTVNLGNLVNKSLSETSTSGSISQTVSLAAAQSLYSTYATISGTPLAEATSGTYSITLNVTTGSNNVEYYLRFERRYNDGTTVATSGFTSPIVCSAGSRTITVTNLDLGTFDADTRFCVYVFFRNTSTMSSASIVYSVSGTVSRVSTPLFGTLVATASGSSTSTGSAAATVLRDPITITASGASSSTGSANIIVIPAPLSLTASGASSSAGAASADVKTPLAATASGASTSTGSAALAIRQALTASGGSTSTGSAALSIIDAVWEATASGASTSTGSAAFTLTIAASGSAASTSSGTATPTASQTFDASAAGASNSTGVAQVYSLMAASGSGAASSTGSAKLILVTTVFSGWGVPI